jgi:hypothetical protein
MLDDVNDEERFSTIERTEYHFVSTIAIARKVATERVHHELAPRGQEVQS